MTSGVQSMIPRMQIVFALFCVHAVVTLPWALANWGASAGGILLLGGWLGLAAFAVPIARERLAGLSFWVPLLCLFLGFRLAALLTVGDPGVVGDPGIYEHLARTLLAGKGLIFHDPLTQTDFRALYPPFYPVLLAGLGFVFEFGSRTFWAANVAMDIVSLLLLVRIGGRIGSTAVGRAAAWLFAIWPAFAFATPFAQKEGLVTLLVLSVAFALLRLHKERNPGWGTSVLMGLSAGALALTQPGLALLPAILGLVLLRRLGFRPLAMLAVKALPFALLLLAPWWIRNFHLFGTFVPLTTTGGLGLWIGNNAAATGNWMPMPDSYRGMPEIAMSGRAAQDALEWIRANPLDFIGLTFFKLFKAMGMEQFTLARFGLMTPQPGPALLASLFPLLQGSLIALLAGAALLAKRARSLAQGEMLILILLGCGVQILLFSLPFEFGERHRYFLMPFLFLLASAGLQTGKALPGSSGRGEAGMTNAAIRRVPCPEA